MSDKPKPGKDKDLRFIRQAMEDAEVFFELLGGEIQEEAEQRVTVTLTATLLLLADQLDQLDQMLSNPTTSPAVVIEHNRQLRQSIRSLLQAELPLNGRQAVARMAFAAGNQLKALLVVKEIRNSP